jgi:tRNA 2-thiouridine synthesizing protein B
MLHTVNKSPLERNALDSCLRHAAPGDVILLIEDGVYGALRGATFTPRINQALQSLRVYALRPDVEARGIGEKLLESVALVDYGGFVELTVANSPIMAWL